MKKVLLVIIFTLSVATCFAAPYNTLEPGHTAIGLVYWGASDPSYVTITYDDWNMGGGYLEHRFSDKLTIGVEGIGRSDSDIVYPDFVDTSLTDICLQYHINDNCRLILGNKSFNQDMYGTSYGYYTDSKTYVGVAFTSNLSDSLESYAALTTADIQVGANLNFSKNFSGNIFYRTCSIANLDLSGIGFGLTAKFDTIPKVITIEEHWYKKGNPQEDRYKKGKKQREEGRDKKGNPKEDKDKKGNPKEDKDKKGNPKEEDKDKKSNPKEEGGDKKGNPKEEDKDKKGNPKEENRDKKGNPKEEDGVD